MEECLFCELLRDNAARMSVGLPKPQAATFFRYHQMVLEASKKMNLVRFKDERDLIGRHYLDSLAVVPHIAEPVRRVVDVGTGAGLPGIPMKIARTDLDVTLVESQAKKVAFLQDCLTKLGLAEARCICERSEDLARSPEHRESYDLAVARALALLPAACEMCLPLVRNGGWFVAYQSVRAAGEVGAARRAMELLGGELAQVVNIEVPLAQMTTALVIVGKRKHTPPEFPRRAGVARKRPL